MNWLDRQSFLGKNSDKILSDARIALIGLGGGGSHVAQQLAHVGVGNFLVSDPDIITSTNLNRLVGAAKKDVEGAMLKVDIAERVIKAVNPEAKVVKCPCDWQQASDLLRGYDIIVGGLDSVRAKDEIDAFCRRFMIPYIDMGMDVFETTPGQYLVSGQVVLTGHGQPCLRCLGIVTEEGLAKEANNYGAAGGRPQVVWPNGQLASCAVGLAVQLLTPWHEGGKASAFLEYDGNTHVLRPAEILRRKADAACPHHSASDIGDPFFRLADIGKDRARASTTDSTVDLASPPSSSSDAKPRFVKSFPLWNFFKSLFKGMFGSDL